MPRPILWIDTETGGLSPTQHDLLSIAAVLDTGEPRSETLVLSAEFSRPVYRAEQSALLVNKLDLGQLRERGQSPEHIDMTCAQILSQLLDLYPGLRIGGQFVEFDLGFIREQMPLTWAVITERGLLRRKVDTKQIAEFLRDGGVIPSDTKVSLEALCGHFGVLHGGHQAAGDAMSCARVYRAMLEYL